MDKSFEQKWGRLCSGMGALVTNFIEERNYLLFTIANRSPTEVKELSTWSLESLYQFLYANTVESKRLEAQRKTDENKSKMKK